MMKHNSHTIMGIVSLILGIISILLMTTGIILPFMMGTAVFDVSSVFSTLLLFSYLEYLIGIPGAIIAIIIGYLAKKQGDSYGLIGLILGAIVLILVVISIIISAMTYLYVSSMLPGPS